MFLSADVDTGWQHRRLVEVLLECKSQQRLEQGARVLYPKLAARAAETKTKTEKLECMRDIYTAKYI